MPQGPTALAVVTAAAAIAGLFREQLQEQLFGPRLVFQFDAKQAYNLYDLPGKVGVYVHLNVRNVGSRQAKDVQVQVISVGSQEGVHPYPSGLLSWWDTSGASTSIGRGLARPVEFLECHIPLDVNGTAVDKLFGEGGDLIDRAFWRLAIVREGKRQVYPPSCRHDLPQGHLTVHLAASGSNIRTPTHVRLALVLHQTETLPHTAMQVRTAMEVDLHLPESGRFGLWARRVLRR